MWKFLKTFYFAISLRVVKHFQALPTTTTTITANGNNKKRQQQQQQQRQQQKLTKTNLKIQICFPFLYAPQTVHLYGCV